MWRQGYLANGIELAAELGLPEDTQTAELILALVQRNGTHAVERIHGPVSWVSWSKTERGLLACSDRTGFYRLYHCLSRKPAFITGDLANFVQNPSVSEINTLAAVNHLHGFPPPGNQTFFRNVLAIEPGTVLHIDNTGYTMHRYWRPELKPMLCLPDDQAYAKALWQLLTEIVSEYLPTGPIGITLSGGLDSSALAATIRAVAPRADLTAFSWISPDLPEADEEELIRATALHLGLKVIPIRADRHWPLSSVEGIHTSPSSPFLGHYSKLWDVTFKTMAEQGIRTAFSGVSGDNLFGGNVYAYPDLLLTGRWLDLARQLRDHLPRSEIGWYRVMRQMVLGPIIRTLLPIHNTWTPEPVPWLKKEHHAAARELLAPDRSAEFTLPGRLQRLAALRDPVVPQALGWLNSLAARHGIEFRHPLWDHRLIDFAASLPTDQTFRAAQRKVIIRNAMRGRLPDLVLDLVGKIYPTAIAEYGLTKGAPERVWDLITNMRAAELGYVDEKALQAHYQAALDGKTSTGLLWQALTLEDWLRRYF